MGNDNSNLNIHYKSKNRTQSIVVDNLDFFAYPPMPTKRQVEAELNEILSQLLLDPDKEKLIRQQPIEIQWKVICKHKQILEDKKEAMNKAAESPVQTLINKVASNPSLNNLDELRIWLEEKATADDISAFLAFNGLQKMLEILENAEINSRITKNYNKQLLILKTFENLVTNQSEVTQKLLQDELGCNVIILNLNRDCPELCNSVFEILNTFCWSSNVDGHTPVINAFNHLKTSKKFSYPFQPLIDLLQNEKNIIVIENVIFFINNLIESSLDEEERRNIRFQFNSCNLKQIFDKVKEKAFNDQFFIDDCVFIPQEENGSSDIKIMNKVSLLGKNIYIEKDQDEFEKHLLQVINQIEVYEKSSDEIHYSSSIDLQESLSQSRRTTKEKLDYTNINSIFEKLKNDSMNNNTFPYFLEILNYMNLIPRNEEGQLIWEKMASVFAEATNLDHDDFNEKIEEIHKLAKETRNIEELEETNNNLQKILATREEEIEKLITEKNKYQLELNKLQKETEEIIKKYQQIEANLEKSLSEKDQELKAKLDEISSLKKETKDSDNLKSDKLKYETKIVELEKCLSAKEDVIRNLERQQTKNETTQNNPPIQISPPPINALLTGQQIPPPPNIFSNSTENNNNNNPTPLPPPLNLLTNQTVPNIGPPPLNLLLGGGISTQGGPPAPPLLLGTTIGGPPAPPLLLGGPPPIANLLGQQSGPPGPPPLLLGGGPPPIGNLLKGGPPGPPLLGNLMPMVNQAVKKVKEKKKPRIPLRGLMWTLVPSTNIKETIWEEIDDEKVELEIDFIEKEFASKKPAASAKTGSKPEDAIQKAIKISLLPGEKTKNMEIVLGKLKLSHSIIRDALNQMDESVLTINNIESLLNIIPNEEEIKTVEGFDGDVDLLGNPEKFTIEINKVAGFKERLQGIKFMKNYEEQVKELSSKIEKINGILLDVPKNKKFKYLIEEILAVGNYLNGTSVRGGAYGFQIDALEKLNDLKMANYPKKNLLMYIIEKYEKKHGTSAIDSNEDLENYELASKTPLSQLQTDLGEIRKGAKIITMAISKSKETDELGKVESYFQGPLQKINEIIEDLDKRLKDCDQNYLNCCKYLCENPKDNPSDKLIEKIYKFWNSCKAAKNFLVKEQELLKKEEQKKLKEKEKTDLQPGKTLTGINSLKMGTPQEIVETLKNRRQTRRVFAELIATKDDILKKTDKSEKIEKEDKETAQKIKPLPIKTIVEESKKQELLQKAIPKEMKEISPLYKKAEVVKACELQEKQGIDKIPIRISYANENKKVAPIAAAKTSTLTKTNTVNVEPRNSGGTIDYLSVLKRRTSQKKTENIVDQANNVNYLANILVDGTMKKNSILSANALITQPNEKKTKN